MFNLKSSSRFLLGVIGFALPISLVLSVTPMQPAYACSPAPGSKASTIAQRVNQTPIVFQGIVKKIEGDTLTIKVKRYLKNNGPEIVRLKGFNRTSCDNFIQKPGGNFIFFAEKQGTQTWNAVYDGAFGSVRSWNQEVQKELRELGLIGKQENTSKCAFDNRKTVETVKNQLGTVKRLNETLYIIVTEDNRSRFAPCNLPEKFKQDGLKMIFSGEVKEIYPTERWAATLFKLTKYKVVNIDKK